MQGVARCAAQGDVLAGSVLVRAGEELAAQVGMVLGRMRSALCAPKDLQRIAFCGSVLTRSLVRNLLPTSAVTPEDERLVPDVSNLAFEFFDGSTWADAWDSTQNEDLLPLAVRVTLAIRSVDSAGVARDYTMSRTIPIACGKLPGTAS